MRVGLGLRRCVLVVRGAHGRHCADPAEPCARPALRQELDPDPEAVARTLARAAAGRPVGGWRGKGAARCVESAGGVGGPPEPTA